MTNEKIIYIFWTCRDTIEAKKLIHQLLEQRLIACASVFPEVESIYRWEGKIEESKETKVILKTAKKHFTQILSHITAYGSYEVPEISQVEIEQANPAYEAWVHQETQAN